MLCKYVAHEDGVVIRDINKNLRPVPCKCRANYFLASFIGNNLDSLLVVFICVKMLEVQKRQDINTLVVSQMTLVQRGDLRDPVQALGYK